MVERGMIVPTYTPFAPARCGGLDIMRLTRWLSLIALLLALPAAADDKPAAEKPSTTTPANKDAKDTKKYVPAGTLVGKLEGFTPATSEGSLEYRAGLGRYAKMEKMDLTFADEVKVWHKNPPEKIDENGNPKKLTPAELDKLKSHDRLTKGLYAGEMSDVHAGQQVQVVLGRLKDAPKKPAPKDKSAAPEKDFVYVTQIVILADEKPPTKPDKKK
jgi:hypothetical protein